jgi:membrane-associated protease RseP (regulator of RpoE activity)
MWLIIFSLLVLCGLLTYAIVRRITSRVTSTPTWLLWLTLMAPPLLTGASTIWFGQIPNFTIVTIACIISWLTYWWSIDRGNRQPKSEQDDKMLAIEPAGAVTVGEEDRAPVEPPQPVRPIDNDEEASLRTCFAWNIFFLEKIEYRPQAVICRGKLKSDSDVAYDTVKDNVRRIFGDRFLVLFQYSLSTGKPFFAVVPNPQLTEPTPTRAANWFNYALALILLLMSLISTMGIGASLARMGMPAMDGSEIWETLQAGIPYAVALLSILGLRDLVRWLVAKFYRIDLSLPYFVPLPFFPGTFGSIVQFRSLIPHRRAVFDLGFASAAAGLVIAIPLLYWGLDNSTVIPLPNKPSGLFNFNGFNPRFSFLISCLSKLALGDKFVADRVIALHPVATAAYIGLFIIAISLMPLRRLDGGFIVQAMFGQKPSAFVSQLSKFILIALGFIRWRTSGITDLFFLGIIISLIPAIDEPPLNDVSEIDSRRDFLGILALAALISIFFPVPGFLMQALGI